MGRKGKAEKKMQKGKEERLLIDYLEETSDFLHEKKNKLRELEASYNESYSRDIREEMDIVKKDIKKKLNELVDMLYENVEELRCIKKYFPDFFAVLLEDKDIGKVLKKHDLLFDTLTFPQAEQHLMLIKQARAQLKDAIKFLEKWPGVIKEKQLTATYPVLKGEIKGDMESSDAINLIREMDKKLRSEGWKIIVSNDSLLARVLERYIRKLKKAELSIAQLKMNYEEAKSRGSVAEYNALKALKNGEIKKEKILRRIKQLLLANPRFLESVKKKTSWLARGKKTELEKIAEHIAPKKIKEKIWFDRMRKKLA